MKNLMKIALLTGSVLVASVQAQAFQTFPQLVEVTCQRSWLGSNQLIVFHQGQQVALSRETNMRDEYCQNFATNIRGILATASQEQRYVVVSEGVHQFNFGWGNHAYSQQMVRLGEMLPKDAQAPAVYNYSRGAGRGGD